MKTRINCLLMVALALFGLAAAAYAQGTAFTYQGRLDDGANPASGNYDLRFAVYDALTAGGQQGVSETNAAVGVTNGLFTVTLDFGSQFPGAARWLEIAVRTNGAATFNTLTPRQPLTATPYAITAATVSGTISSANLGGTYGGAVIFNNAANNFTGNFGGNGTGVTNVNAVALNGLSSSNFWQLGGNNVAPGKFLGSTNAQPMEIWVNNQRGLRLEAGFGGSVNVIGGWSGNGAASGVNGATGGVVAGGGAANYGGQAITNWVAGDFDTVSGGGNNTIQPFTYYATIGGGGANTIQNNVTAPTIGGGANNTIQLFAHGSVISGGQDNTVQTNSTWATIGGGRGNIIQSAVIESTIGGGSANTIQAGDQQSTISGGTANTIQGTNFWSTISGGSSNIVGGAANSSTISGGNGNTISNTAVGATIGGGVANRIISVGVGGANNFATISGGADNQIQSPTTSSTIAGGAGNRIFNSANYSVIGGGLQNTNTDEFSTIPGGYFNVAGLLSFAAGYRAKALNAGTFVWSDSQETNFTSTANNQFLVRAAGGVGINTNNPGATLDVNGSLRVGNGTTVFKNLQGGIAQMASGSSTVKTNFTFNFPRAYSSVPTVVISANSGNVVPVDDTFAVTVRAVTTTTCTVNIVRVDNPSGWSQQVKINWIAWE